MEELKRKMAEESERARKEAEEKGEEICNEPVNGSAGEGSKDNEEASGIGQAASGDQDGAKEGTESTGESSRGDETSKTTEDEKAANPPPAADGSGDSKSGSSASRACSPIASGNTDLDAQQPSQNAAASTTSDLAGLDFPDNVSQKSDTSSQNESVCSSNKSGKTSADGESSNGGNGSETGKGPTPTATRMVTRLRNPESKLNQLKSAQAAAAVHEANKSFKEGKEVLVINSSGEVSRLSVRRELVMRGTLPSQLFKLGQEGKYRVYQNQYTSNPLALNKHQHREENDKRRHLAHKFSLAGASSGAGLIATTGSNSSTSLPGEFKWGGAVHGLRTLNVSTLRLTIIQLENNVPAPFLHPNWAAHRNNWIKAVQMCNKPREFALALAILECAIKPVVMLPVWKESLGHTRLRRMTAVEKEEKEKSRKRERRQEEEEVMQQATWVKYTIPIKHQVWKQKGEEYRVTGYGGWMWVSRTHVARFNPRLPGTTNPNYRQQAESAVASAETPMRTEVAAGTNVGTGHSAVAPGKGGRVTRSTKDRVQTPTNGAPKVEAVEAGEEAAKTGTKDSKPPLTEEKPDASARLQPNDKDDADAKGSETSPVKEEPMDVDVCLPTDEPEQQQQQQVPKQEAGEGTHSNSSGDGKGTQMDEQTHTGADGKNEETDRKTEEKVDNEADGKEGKAEATGAKAGIESGTVKSESVVPTESDSKPKVELREGSGEKFLGSERSSSESRVAALSEGRKEGASEGEGDDAPLPPVDLVNVSAGFLARTWYRRKVKPSRLDGLLERRQKQFVLEERQRLQIKTTGQRSTQSTAVTTTPCVGGTAAIVATAAATTTAALTTTSPATTVTTAAVASLPTSIMTSAAATTASSAATTATTAATTTPATTTTTVSAGSDVAVASSESTPNTVTQQQSSSDENKDPALPAPSQAAPNSAAANVNVNDHRTDLKLDDTVVKDSAMQVAQTEGPTPVSTSDEPPLSGEGALPKSSNAMEKDTGEKACVEQKEDPGSLVDRTECSNPPPKQADAPGADHKEIALPGDACSAGDLSSERAAPPAENEKCMEAVNAVPSSLAVKDKKSEVMNGTKAPADAITTTGDGVGTGKPAGGGALVTKAGKENGQQLVVNGDVAGEDSDDGEEGPLAKRAAKHLPVTLGKTQPEMPIAPPATDKSAPLNHVSACNSNNGSKDVVSSNSDDGKMEVDLMDGSIREVGKADGNATAALAVTTMTTVTTTTTVMMESRTTTTTTTTMVDGAVAPAGNGASPPPVTTSTATSAVVSTLKTLSSATEAKITTGAALTVATTTTTSSSVMTTSVLSTALVAASPEHSTRDRVKLQRFARPRKARSTTALPSYRKFVTRSGRKSVFVLPSEELRKLARRAAVREVLGFSYMAKPAWDVWPYPAPRPTFAIAWRYRLQTVRSLAAASLMLRLLWACLRWDEMLVKPSGSSTRTETTDTEITTTEIIKRRDVGMFGLRSEYCIRKIICPIDVPETTKETPTPQRKGLRSSALRPKKPEGPRQTEPVVMETWLAEEELELWEIRAFSERVEKEKAAALEQHAKAAEHKKNEEFKAQMEVQLKQQRLAAQQKRLSAGEQLKGTTVTLTTCGTSSTPGTTTQTVVVGSVGGQTIGPGTKLLISKVGGSPVSGGSTPVTFQTGRNFQQSFATWIGKAGTGQTVVSSAGGTPVSGTQTIQISSSSLGMTKLPLPANSKIVTLNVPTSQAGVIHQKVLSILPASGTTGQQTFATYQPRTATITFRQSMPGSGTTQQLITSAGGTTTIRPGVTLIRGALQQTGTTLGKTVMRTPLIVQQGILPLSQTQQVVTQIIRGQPVSTAISTPGSSGLHKVLSTAAAAAAGASMPGTPVASSTASPTTTTTQAIQPRLPQSVVGTPVARPPHSQVRLTAAQISQLTQGQSGGQGLRVVVQGQGQTQGQLQLIPRGVVLIPGPGQQLMQAAMPDGSIQRFLFTPAQNLAATPEQRPPPSPAPASTPTPTSALTPTSVSTPASSQTPAPALAPATGSAVTAALVAKVATPAAVTKPALQHVQIHQPPVPAPATQPAPLSLPQTQLHVSQPQLAAQPQTLPLQTQPPPPQQLQPQPLATAATAAVGTTTTSSVQAPAQVEARLQAQTPAVQATTQIQAVVQAAAVTPAAVAVAQQPQAQTQLQGQAPAVVTTRQVLLQSPPKLQLHFQPATGTVQIAPVATSTPQSPPRQLVQTVVSVQAASVQEQLQKIQQMQAQRQQQQQQRKLAQQARKASETPAAQAAGQANLLHKQIVQKQSAVIEQLKAKSRTMSPAEREDTQRLLVCNQVLKSILDRIDRDERTEQKKRKREESVEQRRSKASAGRLSALLFKHKEQLRAEILKKRGLLEKELHLEVQDELKQDLKRLKREEKRPPSLGPAVAAPVASGPSHAAHSPATSPSSASKRKRDSDTTSSKAKRKKMITTSSRGDAKRDTKLYCVCKTPYDSSKFYIGCDLCTNWFHGACVGVTDRDAETMDEYVCDECRNAQEGSSEELYCICKTPYDESQFYIGCDRCQNWFHGRCVGVLQSEAEFIDEYVCPNCQSAEDVMTALSPLTERDYDGLKRILRSMQVHKMAWPFLEPVDEEEAPGYYEVIKEPMDLSTIEKRLSSRFYSKLAEFVGDMTKMFDNCRYYNPGESTFAKCAEVLETFFVQKLKSFKANRTGGFTKTGQATTISALKGKKPGFPCVQ
ncbi:nucleosome-remodeling factor subunit BPTF isoform X9 [Lampetra planeri]